MVSAALCVPLCAALADGRTCPLEVVMAAERIHPMQHLGNAEDDVVFYRVVDDVGHLVGLVAGSHIFLDADWKELWQPSDWAALVAAGQCPAFPLPALLCLRKK